MTDQMVLQTQQWLNKTYGNDPRFKKINPDISVLARAHSEAEVKHLLEHGADAAVLAERELAYSLADMVMATPPYRAPRVEAAPASG